ncbi:MAG: hypothetical protein GEV11_06585 [Streptosporangiales bacterium]|nr:hypothetical protein [Streptosporangiales bacterium]
MSRRVSRRHTAAAGACVMALIGATLIATPAGAAAVPAAPFDFNGDGRRDLAIGSPNASVAGHASAGLLSVVFGTAAGLDTNQRRVYSEFPESVPSEPFRNDRFGSSVDSADFNRDGFADIVIGAPGEGGSTGPDEGMAMFALGGPYGFTNWQGVSVAPGNENDRYGESVAAGDLDNDGYAEAIIAAPGTGSLEVWSFAPVEGTSVASKQPRRVERIALPKNGDVGTQAVGAEFFRVDTGDVFGDAGQELVALWRDEQGEDPLGQGNVGMLTWDGGEPSWTEPLQTIGHTLAVGSLDGDAPAEVVIGQYSDGGFAGGQVTVWQQGDTPSRLTGAKKYN